MKRIETSDELSRNEKTEKTRIRGREETWMAGVDIYVRNATLLEPCI